MLFISSEHNKSGRAIIFQKKLNIISSMAGGENFSSLLKGNLDKPSAEYVPTMCIARNKTNKIMLIMLGLSGLSKLSFSTNCITFSKAIYRTN